MEEAKLLAHCDMRAKKHMIEEAMDGCYTKAMARAGPARWDNVMPGKKDLIRVLTAQLNESYDVQLRLIKERAATKQGKESKEGGEGAGSGAGEGREGAHH